MLLARQPGSQTIVQKSFCREGGFPGEVWREVVDTPPDPKAHKRQGPPAIGFRV